MYKKHENYTENKPRNLHRLMERALLTFFDRDQHESENVGIRLLD